MAEKKKKFQSSHKTIDPCYQRATDVDKFPTHSD